MNIRISKVYIENYKSIFSQLIQLKDMSVFFGQNNTGKTNILKAINLGLTFESMEAEDVHDSRVDPYSKEKKVIIDILFEPYEKGKKIANFDDGWGLVIGDMISIDPDENESFAFRTEISFDEDRNIYKNSKKIIQKWDDNGNKQFNNKFNSRIFDYIQCYYVDAHRDIANDLKSRRSFWAKLISKINIDDGKKNEIQDKLQEINESIRSESEIIQLIENELNKTVSGEKYDINISPLTRDLETLYKGIDIYYSNDKFNPVPVSNLGSGIRSWAVFSTIKSQIELYSKSMNRNYSIFLVEEPESHVHPQSQMHLMKVINEIEAQKIITTHSPYVVNQVDINCLVRIDKDSNGTNISPLDANIVETDINEIRRSCLDIKGELMFSKVVVLVEGATELMAFPLYFQYYFGKRPFELGVTFISADGGGKYKPFLQLLNAFNLKWILLSDGEKVILNGLRNILRGVMNNTEIEITDEKRILYYDDGHNYEQYLYCNKYKDQIQKGINDLEDTLNFIETTFITNSQWTQHKSRKINKKITLEEELELATFYYIKKNKINMTTVVAEEIINGCTSKNDLPPKIIELFEKIGKEIDFND